MGGGELGLVFTITGARGPRCDIEPNIAMPFPNRPS
jgi:hypothetical protein